MDKRVVVILVVLTTVTYISSALVTKQDINYIDREIWKLKRLINQLKRSIRKVKKERSRFDAGSAKNVNNLTDRAELHQKDIAGKQKWLVGWAKRRSAWYLKQVPRRITNKIAAALRSKRRGEQTKFRNFLKTDTNVKKFIRASVRQIAKQRRKKVLNNLKLLKEFGKKVDAVKQKTMSGLNDISGYLYLTSRQVQLQQFNELEKARSDGNSGIKQINTHYVGEKNYHSNDYSGLTFAGMTDKEASKQKVGISSMTAVLNGFEFRTNDNSYSLQQPVSNDKILNKVEDITHPDVPPAVQKELDLGNQIEEMRAWFKAFQNQDEGLREFKPYFQPVISYLEGAWIKKTQSSLKQSYYSSDTGFNINKVSYLPQTMFEFTDDKKPIYSQWTYRFLSHKLANYLSPKLLRLLVDVTSEKRSNKNHEQYKCGGAARFDIEGIKIDFTRTFPEKRMIYSLLDLLMEEIPGKDNYGSVIKADGFDAKILSANPTKIGKTLNGAYYHRPYKLESKDAMGVDSAQRGYCDRFYVALTNQESVSGPAHLDKKKIIKIKASYAVPVELIYLTPLNKWNPFDVKIEDSCNLVTGLGTESNPYSAACPDRYLLTPDSFFTGGAVGSCSNNTDIMYFTSPKSSSPVCLRGSGIRISLPQIHGINGRIRQRYPIMPVNGEGSSVWKKLNAIEDSLSDSNIVKSRSAFYTTGESTSTTIPIHKHRIVLTIDERNGLLNGDIKNLKKVTLPGRHRHVLILNKVTVGGKSSIGITSCDSGKTQDTVCFDKHHNIAIEDIC